MAVQTPVVLLFTWTIYRRVAPSSTQFGWSTPVQAGRLTMAEFRASTNCLTGGLLFHSQIAPNVFSSGSSFRFLVSQYVNFFSPFTLLHTCWTAAIVSSHPVSERSGMNLLTTLVKKGPSFYFTTVIAFCQYSKGLLALLSQQWWGLHHTQLRAVSFLNKCSCW